MKALEGNYTKTPNLSLAIIACFPGSAGRVYATMIRFAYGWKKDTVKLGIATLSKLTGLSKNGVKAGAEMLININAISRLNAEDQKNAMWKINDPSIIDPSIFDPSFFDAFIQGDPSIFDAYDGVQASKIDPHPPHIKERVKERVKRNTTTGRKNNLGGGGRSGSTSKDWIHEMQLHEIWIAAGLGKQKIDEVLIAVAEKFTPANAKRNILAALASAYADSKAKNKPIVAAYRLENNQVPPEFTSSDTWHVIPKSILEAANVDVERLQKKSSISRTIETVLGLE